MGVSDLPTYPDALRSLEETRRGEKWAQKALDAEASIVAGAANGTRNATLNNSALKLGHKVAGGYLQAAEVEAALMSAARQSGLVQEDGPEAALATIRSGLSAGMQEPEHPRDRPDYQPQPQPRGPTVVRPTPQRESRFYSAASLKGKSVPPRQWLVDGLVPQKTVTLFSGDGGTGKSLLALQLAIAVATGTGWIGRPVKTGRVIFLSAEDDDEELHRRTDDILRAEGRDYDDLSGLTLRSLAGEDALLAVETQLALMQSELFKELDARAAEESPALVVIDTLADVYPANENDRAKVRQFVGILRGLALKRRCAVMLLGHPSLTGLSSGSGTSGSTAWNNSVRSRLYLSRIEQDGYESDPDKRVLTTKKANYGRVWGEINMTWREGVFVPDSAPQGLDAMAANAKAERVFLKLLAAFTAQGRRVNATAGAQYAPKVFAEHPQAEGMTKRALRPAMEALLASGRLVVETEGPPSRRVSYLAEARQ